MMRIFSQASQIRAAFDGLMKENAKMFDKTFLNSFFACQDRVKEAIENFQLSVKTKTHKKSI